LVTLALANSHLLYPNFCSTVDGRIGSVDILYNQAIDVPTLF